MATETYTSTQLRVGDFPAKDRIAYIKSGNDLAIGAVLRKELQAAAGLDPDDGNTGNGTPGTVTLGSKAQIGTYNVTCIGQAGALAAAALAAGGSNVGNGTPGSVTLGADAKAGTYTLRCIDAGPATEHIAVEDLAADADIAARPIFVAPAACELVSIGILTKAAAAGVDDANTAVIEVTDDAANSIVSKTYNTGTQPPDTDFESLGALSATHKKLAAGEHLLLNVTCGTTANLAAFDIVLVYKLAGSAADAGTFEVIDPDGFRLDNLTVAEAYSNDHFALTIADGTTDFAVGDTFTFAVTLNANASTFLVTDPQGRRLTDLVVGVAYDNDHFAVTLADGSTDFVVGDTFALVVTATGKSVPYDDPDAIFDGILAEAVDASTAAAYGTAYVAGHFRRGVLSFADGTTLNDAIEQALALHGVYLTSAQS